MTLKPKQKQPRACWTSVKSPRADQQRKQLRPEATAAGGIKARSGSEASRMAVYNAIRAIYLSNPLAAMCYGHARRNASLVVATQIHHKQGRAGLLLFDVRNWIPLCQECHDRIGTHPEEARQLGLLCKRGEWNKQDATRP